MNVPFYLKIFIDCVLFGINVELSSPISRGNNCQVLDTNCNGHNRPYLVCELTHIMANASPVDNSVSISVEQRSRLGLIYCTILIITAETAIATTKATKLNQQQDHDWQSIPDLNLPNKAILQPNFIVSGIIFFSNLAQFGDWSWVWWINHKQYATNIW